MNADDAVIVALGSNQALGAAGPQKVLEAALARFAAFALVVVKRSGWWRSMAWPDASQPAFLNGVVWVKTELGPREVMDALLEIEMEFGRERSQPNAPRTLDLDLVAYGREVLRDVDQGSPPSRGGRALQLPHPRAHERLFVMGPLAEIAPDWRHPVLEEMAKDLIGQARVGLDARPVV